MSCKGNSQCHGHSHPLYVAHLLEAGGVPAFDREEAWTEFMEETIGLKIAHRGDTNHERLIFRVKIT